MKNYTNSQIIELIMDHIHSVRDRKILIDRFVNGLSFKELESKYNLSERQIKKIVYRADKVFISLLH